MPSFKRWIDEGEERDCLTTTEATLTRDLSEDLSEAWARLRETYEVSDPLSKGEAVKGGAARRDDGTQLKPPRKT